MKIRMAGSSLHPFCKPELHRWHIYAVCFAAEYVDSNLKSKQKTPEEEMINPFSQNVLCNSLIDKDIKTL